VNGGKTSEAIRTIAIHVLTFLGIYVALTGLAGYVLVETFSRDVGVSWPLFWMIWVFAYWPMAMGAAFTLWRLEPPARRAALVHSIYIGAVLVAMVLTAMIGSWWPMFAVKLAGLSFIFYCITGFRRSPEVE